MKELHIARELILISKMILSYRYVHDPEHLHKPEGPGWHKTDKGWSDSKLSPPGEKSLLEAVFKDPDFLGKGIGLIHQKRIKIYLEKYKRQNPEIIKATEEQFQRSLEKDEENKVYTYETEIQMKTGGNYGYTFRVMPKVDMLLDSENLNLVKWITK